MVYVFEDVYNFELHRFVYLIAFKRKSLETFYENKLAATVGL